ncbi:MAG: hypothetical protein ACXAC8_19725 [Candidatus Hodarchaeales archaeon]|jgi:hypothetical protein
MESSWNPNRFDLLLAVLIVLTLPILARILYFSTGALIPLIIYYGAAWGIFIWRRGNSGYSMKTKVLIPRAFVINVIVIGLALVCAFLARNKDLIPNSTGAILTGLIWAPINAASEQLLWIYLYDSWDLYNPPKEQYSTRNRVWIQRIVGFILFTAFVGTIHTFFWVEFLETVTSDTIFGMIFILLTSLSGYIHILAWRESNNMVYTFIPHFLLNLVPLFWTGYSILPFLIK